MHPLDPQGDAKLWTVTLTLIILNKFEQLSAIAINPHRAARGVSRHSDNFYFSHRDYQVSKHSEANFLLFNWGAIPSVHNVGFGPLVQQSS